MVPIRLARLALRRVLRQASDLSTRLPENVLMLAWVSAQPQVQTRSMQTSLWALHEHTHPKATGAGASSIQPQEAQKFAAMARQWWDPDGPFAPLHRMNPTR